MKNYKKPSSQLTPGKFIVYQMIWDDNEKLIQVFSKTRMENDQRIAKLKQARKEALNAQ